LDKIWLLALGFWYQALKFMKNFRELTIWNDSLIIVKIIYKLTQRPKTKNPEAQLQLIN